MCPPREIHQRTELEVGAQANFEIGQNGGNFAQHAVRRFDRSAAGKTVLVTDVRPPVILYHTFSYLRDCILD